MNKIRKVLLDESNSYAMRAVDVYRKLGNKIRYPRPFLHWVDQLCVALDIMFEDKSGLMWQYAFNSMGLRVAFYKYGLETYSCEYKNRHDMDDTKVTVELVRNIIHSKQQENT